jgi:hypothetical protein
LAEKNTYYHKITGARHRKHGTIRLVAACIHVRFHKKMAKCRRRGWHRGGTLVLLATAGLWSTASAASGTLSFSASGYTTHGSWSGDVTVSPAYWKPGDTITVDATLRQAGKHAKALMASGIAVDNFILLVTAERTFDFGGHLRLPYDQYMSTLITPTGLPIEGGSQGAITKRFGGPFRGPVDEFTKVPLVAAGLRPDSGTALLHASAKLPDDLPPGVYRLRIDYGVSAGSSNYSLNGDGFASQPFFRGTQPQSFVYSPLIPADGTTLKGAAVQGSSIQPRVPWVLLNSYNSNGYRGVVAEEDRPYFAIAARNIIQDDVVLPRFDASGRALSYNLEPQMIANSNDPCIDIPWDYASGEMSVEVTQPDGTTVSLGKYPFLRQNGAGPTTGRAAVTAWVPPAYGQYAVKATGWIKDIYGARYEAGGTYRFWIANRLTLATATFQGMPYPVGSTYGRDTAFAPPVPADVTVTATLYPDSDPAKATSMTWSGRASVAGVFGAMQGNKSFPLSQPGEYCARVLATYTDARGHLWVSTMRHAGVVYDPNGPIVARGKKLAVNGSYLERGDTRDEGYIDTTTDSQHLIHLNFPYNPADVLLIASDGQGANKIIPTLTYENRINPQRDDAGLNGIGTTNLQLKTSNGYSPHMYPEYITEWGYYYGAAARPGFVSRFIVGETAVRGPYWSVSPNSFGGQINASSNGDVPGDIYRLMGGVVLRKADTTPAYAGYIASSFILPRGVNNNRVIAPGSEELIGSTGQRSKIFLVGPRPGMTYPVGTTFGAALQIDPILPVNITFKLTYPDGHTAQTSGVSDAYGSFSGKDRFLLDTPGLYKFTLDANWNGNPAIMPGLPKEGGEIYVLEAQLPPGATGIQVTNADGATFDPVAGVHITGKSTADKIRYAVVMPGAVLESGDLTVANGQFDYYFSPTAMHAKAETYDTTNRVSGKPELGDVIHLTLFSQEKTADGLTYHSFARVVLRGNQVRVTR